MIDHATRWLDLLPVFTLAYAGLGALCLSMERHYADLHGRGAAPTRELRRNLQLAGWSALILALASAIGSEGGPHGVMLWLGGLSGAGLALVLLLPYAPRLASQLAQAAGAGGALLFLLRLALR